jgi:hypothetical protein
MFRARILGVFFASVVLAGCPKNTPTPPIPPTPQPYSVHLKWTEATPGVQGYAVFRDDAPLAVVAAPTTTFVDTTVKVGPYKYSVEACFSTTVCSPMSNVQSVTVP